jgi:hypothetical protein
VERGALEMFDRRTPRTRRFVGVETIRCLATLTLMAPDAEGRNWIGVARKEGAHQTRVKQVARWD